METFKFEDAEIISNSDHMYAGKENCILEESDTQCGYVFFNEITRLLKFYCTYCRETFDNIEFYCQHLGDHINESNEEISTQIKEQVSKSELDEVDELKKNEDDLSSTSLGDDEVGTNMYPSHENDEDTSDAFEYGNQFREVSYFVREDTDSVNNVDNEEMLVEEIDEDDGLQSEMGEEVLEMEEEGNNNLFLTENSSLTESGKCQEKQQSALMEISNGKTDDINSGKSFEECFIQETNIDKIRSEGVCVLKEKSETNRNTLQRKRSNIQDLLRLKRRRKKVTTVKVIAVKNRIAELYERIQSEQQKSQQIFSNDFLKEHQEQETQDAVESLIKDEVETDTKSEGINKNQTNDDKINFSTSEISRKIIGETLITLIPEGTKIPNKMPSPLHMSANNELSNKEHLSITSPSYNHYKKNEDKKEKVAVCPACGKTFRSHFSLTIHKRIHYLESDSSVKLAHKCSDCDQLFNKLSQLKHHVETVHYPEGFICKICNRQLSSLSLLERHMVKVHLDRPFNCKKCNKNFSDPITFEEHLASHNSGEVYKCSTCGRKYSTEYFLLEHMRNHKEQVPQTCVVCGKVTLRITQHMKIHTPRPKRLLSCSECGKVFNFSSGLSHHFKIMHKLPRPPPKPKKETNGNAFKRKRRSRANDRSLNKKKQLLNSCLNESTYIIDNEKFPDQIIEEQIEIPHEVYDVSTNAVVLDLQKSESRFEEQPASMHNSSQTYDISNTHDHKQVVIQNFQDTVINHKEEEAKRVIVELIQNSTYTSFFPDNLSSVLEVTPPIAREETISAVNSIVHDC